MKAFENTHFTSRLNNPLLSIRYIIIFIAVMMICTALPELSLAQNSAKVTSEDKNGLLKTSFTTLEGTVTVYLPANFSEGEKISGTVQLEPDGKNDRQLQKNSAELSGYVVEMENQKAKAGNGKATWLMPAAVAGTATYLILKDHNGNPLASHEIPLQQEVFNSGKITDPGFSLPDHFSSTQPVEIQGGFDGEFGNTEIDFDGQTGNILAESENAVFVEAPEDVTGPVDITINENGQIVSGTSNAIDLSLSADHLNLQNGQTANVTMTVSGLEGIDQPVTVDIINLTPNVISMTGGLTDQITINPGDAFSDGSFVHTFPVSANIPGNFSIAADVQPDDENNFIPVESEDPSTFEEEQLEEDNPVIDNSDQIEDFFDPETFAEPGIVNPNDLDNPGFDGNALSGTNFSDINFGPSVIANVVGPAILATIVVDITDEEKRDLRNEGRGIPQTTPLTPSDPDDDDAPYSRPIPPGLGGDDHDSGSVWKDPDALLRRAQEEVDRAGRVTGHPSPGDPGYGTIGIARPDHTIVNESTGCTEYVYYFYQQYPYLDDVTLVHEEQLSPSFEFFVATGTTKIDITEHTSYWEVETSASAGIGPVEVGVSGKYGESTTRITGGSVSRIVGRNLWLFHIGRLYLYRKAYLLITYEYHYEVCEDGSTRNWVETKYEDNWYYAYKWVESLVIASKDDEGNFHEIQSIPLGSSTVEEDHWSYEAESLEQESFDNPGDWDFFPEVQ